MGYFMRRSTKKRVALFAGIMTTFFVVLWFGRSMHEPKRHGRHNIRHVADLSAVKHLAKRKVPLEPNVVRSRPSSLLMYEECINLPEAPIDTKICIYPGKFDTKYSDILKKGRLYEKDFATSMAKMLRHDHEMQLVDLGANLGVYTLMAAAWGSKVLAVEKYPDNIRQLQTSLSISGLSSYVTLVNNAFWSDHRSQQIEHISRARVGKDHFANIPMKNFNKWGQTNDNTGKNTVNTICMDDLLPLLKFRKVYLKLDLDGDEAEALKCSAKFFDLVDVRVVQMKWIYKTPSDISRIKAYMEGEFGFRASRDPRRIVPVPVNSPTALKNNLYWLPRNTDNVEDEEVEKEQEEEQEEDDGLNQQKELLRNKYKDYGEKSEKAQKIMLNGMFRKKKKPKMSRSNIQKDKEFRFHQEVNKKGKKPKGGIFWKNNMVG